MVDFRAWFLSTFPIFFPAPFAVFAEVFAGLQMSFLDASSKTPLFPLDALFNFDFRVPKKA